QAGHSGAAPATVSVEHPGIRHCASHGKAPGPDAIGTCRIASSRKPGDRPGRRLVAMRRASRRQRAVAIPHVSFRRLPMHAAFLTTPSRGRARCMETPMKPQHQLLSLAVALALSPLAHAGGVIQATDLDTVVVTATRTAINAEDANVPVQVLDRTAIERSQATSLVDLLRGRAGINLANQGGAGKLSSVFLRGTESDHVLVLVDGVRIGSATSGMAAFQDLPLDQFERIEIVRGPRSSLYGSE